jgi:hypothetical protein
MEAHFPEPTLALPREVAAEAAPPPQVDASPGDAVADTAEAPAGTIDATHWTARLLAPGGEETAVAPEARRAAIGLGLAAIYGLAAGARHGGLAFAKSAALVPAALLATCAFGLPALYIALGMVDAPLAPRRLFAAAARAIASAGLVLAGLAPVAALYVVSSGDLDGAAIATALGLVVGSLAGLRVLWRDIAAEVHPAHESVRLVTMGTVFGFAVFAAAVGCRVWTHLPIFAPSVVR